MTLMSLVKAIAMTIKSKKSLAIIILSSLAILVAAFIVQAFTIPGNSIEMQLSLTTPDSALLTLLFSLLFGLSVGMHAHATELSKSSKSNTIAHSAGTGFFSLTGAMFAGKLCPVCISGILSFIGLGTSAAFFVFSHKTEILVLSIIPVLFSIHIAGKRISVI